MHSGNPCPECSQIPRKPCPRCGKPDTRVHVLARYVIGSEEVCADCFRANWYAIPYDIPPPPSRTVH